MEIKPIYAFCEKLEPFIAFDAKLENGETISCVGHEWHCCDPKCDCYLANIMIHEANSEDRLTQIIYGWRNYGYYKQEKFYEEDIKEFIKGELSVMERKDNRNKAILEGFKTWLSSGYEEKVKLFDDRYKQFKTIAKNKCFDEAKELEIFTNSMHQLIKVGKLEDFIPRFKIK